MYLVNLVHRLFDCKGCPSWLSDFTGAVHFHGIVWLLLLSAILAAVTKYLGEFGTTALAMEGIAIRVVSI
jgi:hypothetical protein